MKNIHILAFDIGATSGRAIVAYVAENTIEMKEINRFPNSILELHGKYYWDIYALYAHLKESLVICARKGIRIDSIGIDTWGVDFGYIGKDGSLLGLPRAYRDPFTQGVPDVFFRKMPKEEVYRRTGIQVMDFNSLYQLYQAKKERFEPLLHAEKILFIPDLLSYMLTGKQVYEYTDASTSQLLNPRTKDFDMDLLLAADVKPSIVGQIVMPGTQIGSLSDAIARDTGVGKVPVIAVAGHDTASAVAAVPAKDNQFAYLSSGTWSLMGIESEIPVITEDSFKHNFTNEGGVEGTTRFLKNITGMWLLEQCRKEWEKQGKSYSYPQIVEMAESASAFTSLVNPDDKRFANPPSMLEAIAGYCKESGQPAPASDAEYIRCIFRSLANRYREVFGMLSDMAPFPIKCLHVIGGGSKNSLLNQFTADALGVPVIAGPSEATAIGNCMVQAKAAGLFSDRWEYRQLIAKAFPTETFLPGRE